MGRVIGDGGCFFEVVDIAVVPAHRGWNHAASFVAWPGPDDRQRPGLLVKWIYTLRTRLP